MIRFANRNQATFVSLSLSRSLSCSLLVSVALAASVAPGCGGPGDDARSPASRAGAPEETGRVSLPLVTSVGDHLYRLRNVYIYIYGAQYAQIFGTDDPGETTLGTTLQTGAYTAYLANWRLERADVSGAFQAVEASLVSSSAVDFTIFNGTTSMVSFEFQSDGVIVRVGAGALKVKADVNEIAAACTPFGSDCPEGSWCPPTGLTGQRRTCIAIGPVAVGQPCLSPFDCAANASCFDRGAGVGTICVPLCPAAGADMACPSGGTCQAVDDEYGVCRSGLDELL